MNETTPKISVIVPVYKAEAYLHRCVDSILAQTFQDFEVLLIDDGSPDRSGEICDEYARKDNRVRVFHKENGGVSSARNLGLDNAIGEWITFVDSDDYVNVTYLDDFGLGKCDAEIYLQGYQIFQNGKQGGRSIFSVEEIKIIPFSECLWEGESRVIINYPWAKLFNLSVIKKYALAFDLRISYGEDHLFVLSYLSQIYRTAVSPATSYNYICGENASLSTRIIPLKEVLYYAEQTYKLQNAILKHRNCNVKQMKEVIQRRIYDNWIVTLKSFYLSKICSIENFGYIRNAFSRLLCGYKGLLFHQKILLWLFIHLPVCLSYRLLGLYVCIRLH